MAYLVTLHTSALAGAWGRVYAIEIRGNGLCEPLIITDSAIVDDLSFWVGPGTGFSDFMGPVNLDRSIVDWSQGEATKKPSGLANFEVRFLLEPRDSPTTYIVLYEPDPANRSGYIYFTGRGSNIVAHGVTGTWWRASVRWDERVGAAISEHVTE